MIDRLEMFFLFDDFYLNFQDVLEKKFPRFVLQDVYRYRFSFVFNLSNFVDVNNVNGWVP